MQLISLSFLLGVVLLHQHSELPNIHLVWLLIPLLFMALFKPLRLVSCVVIGYLWALFIASLVLNDELHHEHEGKDLVVIGEVVSLPAEEGRRLKFNFRVNSATLDGRSIDIPRHIKLSWYQPYPELQLGQIWQLQVRLKRPRGLRNPGGFDYERWLFSERIRAQGYIRNTDANKSIAGVASTSLVAQWRQSIWDGITHHKDKLEHYAMLAALSIGERQAMSQQQWQVLLATGTNHLMAISGLHVGLVAGVFFFLGRWLWSRSTFSMHRLPAPKAGALMAICGAFYYSLLAGFSIPTQRAFIMVVVVMISILQLKQRSPSNILAFALLAVLIWDPLSVLSASFWLSFVAVGLLIFALSSRVATRGWWWQWGKAQWVLFIGLMPFLVFIFQKISLVAPLANMVAVPWVSIVVVPLCLFASSLSLLNNTLGHFLFELTNAAFSIIWVLLEWLSQISWAQWSSPTVPLWVCITTLIGALLFLAPRGLPVRWIGFIWCLPLLFYEPIKPKHGELWLTLLDVGQGLAVVIQTQNHTLLYDTGPQLSARFDAGQAAVIPFLRSQSIDHVDKLIVGHGDNDHIGGANYVLQHIEVKDVITSVPGELSNYDARLCVPNMSWQWGGVSFEMLHPNKRFRGSENDRSCVLKIQTEHASVLIPGDIEKRAERHLVKHAAEQLDADILIAPHHGSATSSTSRFLDAVSPEVVLFATGYRNRYGFPKAEIIARYEDKNTAIFDTAVDGAITFKLNSENDQLHPNTFRSTNRYYWYGKASGVMKSR